MDSSGRTNAVGQHVRAFELATLVCASLLVNLAVTTALAGQFTTLTLHQDWPYWSELGLDALVNVYTNPGDPMHAWPTPGSGPGPTTAYWIFFTATLAALTDLSITVGRILRGELR